VLNWKMTVEKWINWNEQHAVLEMEMEMEMEMEIFNVGNAHSSTPFREKTQEVVLICMSFAYKSRVWIALFLRLSWRILPLIELICMIGSIVYPTSDSRNDLECLKNHQQSIYELIIDHPLSIDQPRLEAPSPAAVGICRGWS